MRRIPRALRLVVLVALVGVVPPPTSGGTSGRPNILMIVTDDQRANGTLGVLDDTRRWFGDGGTKFTRAFATTPLCCPARASIFTGNYAHNHNVRTNHDAGQLDHASTIQRYLRGAGYKTAIVGKFLNGWDVQQDPPYFDRWAIASPPEYYDATWNVDGTLRNIGQYSTDYIADRTVGLIRDFEIEDGRPWVLFVEVYAPHIPLTPEPDYANAPVGEWNGNPAVFEADKSDKPAYVQAARATIEDGRRFHEGQLRLLMSVDDLVARVFQTLKEEGEVANTLAFLTSDNGFLWSEHGLMRKRLPYTQSIRIPFFMRWPGRVEAGAVDRRLVGNIDIVRTIMKAVGISPDPDRPVDGRSLLNRAGRARILTEGWDGGGGIWASTRARTYQYIEYYGDGGAITFREYYDLVADPWQLTNVLADGNPSNNPDVVALSAQLASDRSCVGAAACP